MKRFLTLAALALIVGVGIFIAWMNTGGGAAVELSDDEMAAARESGAGAQAIVIELSESQAAATGESATDSEEASAAAEPLIPRLEDLKTVTDRARLERWAARTRAAREASSGEERLLLTVLLAEIERLRSRAGGGAGLGALEAVLEAGGAKQRWLAEIQAAVDFVRILAYTFDLGEVVDELLRCRTRRVDVQIIVDKGQSLGRTTYNLRPAVIRMLSHGITVRVLEGRALSEAYGEAGRSAGRAAGRSGIMHAKTLWTENIYMCGSCNWTVSSQANLERVCVVRPTAAGAAWLERDYTALWAAAVDFAQAEIDRSPPTARQPP